MRDGFSPLRGFRGIVTRLTTLIIVLAILVMFQSPTGIQRNCYLGRNRFGLLGSVDLFQSPTGIQRNCYCPATKMIHGVEHTVFQSPTGIQRNCYEQEV
jgi:hypothetical protein